MMLLINAATLFLLYFSQGRAEFSQRTKAAVWIGALLWVNITALLATRKKHFHGSNHSSRHRSRRHHRSRSSSSTSQ